MAMSCSSSSRWPETHLDGVIAVKVVEGWASLTEDRDRAHRVFTAPGVVNVVAVERGDAVVGYAQMQTDSASQAHLSEIAVLPSHRRLGIARRLLQAAFDASGAERIDLITKTADDFYSSLNHQQWNGYQIYPRFDQNAPGANEQRIAPNAVDDRYWIVRVDTTDPVWIVGAADDESTRILAVDADGEHVVFAVSDVLYISGLAQAWVNGFLAGSDPQRR